MEILQIVSLELNIIYEFTWKYITWSLKYLLRHYSCALLFCARVSCSALLAAWGKAGQGLISGF